MSDLSRKLKAIQKALVKASDEYVKNRDKYGRLIGAGWLNIAHDYVDLARKQVESPRREEAAR